MTDYQLSKMEIIPDKTINNPRRYWCNITESHVNIFRHDTQKDIIDWIYTEAFNNGVREGKTIRSKEFKALINDK